MKTCFFQYLFLLPKTAFPSVRRGFWEKAANVNLLPSSWQTERLILKERTCARSHCQWWTEALCTLSWVSRAPVLTGIHLPCFRLSYTPQLFKYTSLSTYKERGLNENTCDQQEACDLHPLVFTRVNSATLQVQARNNRNVPRSPRGQLAGCRGICAVW